MIAYRIPLAVFYRYRNRSYFLPRAYQLKTLFYNLILMRHILEIRCLQIAKLLFALWMISECSYIRLWDCSLQPLRSYIFYLKFQKFATLSSYVLTSNVKVLYLSRFVIFLPINAALLMDIIVLIYDHESAFFFYGEKVFDV